MRSGFGLLLFLISTFSFAATYEGRVVAISDGDTVTVLDARQAQHKVRLLGIDAPEKRQPFGNVSKQHLSRLIHGEIVSVEWNKRDRYKRELGKLTHADTDINLAQVRAGLAWHYKQFVREQTESDRLAYSQAEADARENSLGLWAGIDPMPPWIFRKMER